MEIDAHSLCRTRERKGISQRALAQRLNVSQRTISRWESGHERCHPKYWDELEAVLGVNIQTLYADQVRDDIVDEMVERGLTQLSARHAYDSSIGPMLAEKMAEYDPPKKIKDPLLQQIVDAWPTLSDTAKVKVMTLLAEIKNR